MSFPIVHGCCCYSARVLLLFLLALTIVPVAMNDHYFTQKFYSSKFSYQSQFRVDGQDAPVLQLAIVSIKLKCLTPIALLFTLHNITLQY